MLKNQEQSPYVTVRAAMIAEVARMVESGLLDRLGGSLAMRLDDGNILITPTTAAFRRWQIEADELVVMTPNGAFVEGGDLKAAAATPLFLKLFASFSGIGAIAHSHCPHALAFAAAGKPIPAATNGAELLGEIPCIRPDESDTVVKERAMVTGYQPAIPSALVQRPEVYAVNERLGPLVVDRFRDRAGELERHGLGFLLEKHGLFVMARHLAEATENIERLETAARAAIFAKFVSMSQS